MLLHIALVHIRDIITHINYINIRRVGTSYNTRHVGVHCVKTRHVGAHVGAHRLNTRHVSVHPLPFPPAAHNISVVRW